MVNPSSNNKVSRKRNKRTKKSGKTRRLYDDPGSSYLGKSNVKAITTTTYSAIAGTAVANGFTFTTATPFTSWANFGIVVTNLWTEYRVVRITLNITFTYNTAVSGLYAPSIYLAQFRGDTAPAATIAGLTAIPWVKVRPTVNNTSITWTAPKDDPEPWIFRQTSAAAPVTGGIVGYIGAAAPTSNVSYMVIKASYVIEVRSRKV